MNRNDNENNDDIKALVAHFEQSFESGETEYFDVDELEDIAEYYFRNDEVDEVKNVVEVGEKLHPSDDGIKFLKAKLLYAQGEYKAVMCILNKLSDQEDVDALLLRGRCLLALNKKNDARNTFVLLADLYSDDQDLVSIYLDIAEAFEVNGMYDDALKYLKNAYDIDPKDRDVLIELTYVTEQNNDVDDCIKYHNEIIDLDPYSPAAWRDLGRAYADFGIYEKSLDAYDYALAILPNNFEMLMQKGLLLYTLDRTEEALEVYKQCEEQAKDTNNTVPTICVGDAYMKLGNYGKAYEKYQEALSVRKNDDDGYAELLFQIGVAAFNMRRYVETQNIMEELLAMDPNDIDAMEFRADAFFLENCDNINMDKDCERLYQQILDKDENNYDALKGLGRVKFNEEDYRGALSYMNKALAVEKDDHMLWVIMAVSYFKLGDTDSMAATLKEALKISKDAVNDFFKICPEATDTILKYF